MRIELQPLLEVLLCLIEPPQVAIREPQKCVGTGGVFEFKKLLEFFDGLLDLSGHEVAFPQRSQQVGSLAEQSADPTSSKRNRILKIILRHAYLGHEEDDIGVLRS